MQHIGAKCRRKKMVDVLSLSPDPFFFEELYSELEQQYEALKQSDAVLLEDF